MGIGQSDYIITKLPDLYAEKSIFFSFNLIIQIATAKHDRNLWHLIRQQREYDLICILIIKSDF